MWPFPTRAPEPQFRSRMTLPPSGVVVLLGAGASADAGCPLMRDFIDRARDFRTTGKFSPSETESVDAALKLHSDIRTQFHLTELDSENIETLMSIADFKK